MLWLEWGNDGRWELIGTLSGSGTTGDSSAQKGLATNVSMLHDWLEATAATTTPEADIWSVEFVLVLVLGAVVVIVVFRAFRRLRRRGRPVMGPAAPVQRARDEDLEYLERWALERTGVEAYYAFFAREMATKNELVLTHSDLRARPSTPVKRWREDRTAHSQFLAYADNDAGGD